MSYDTLLRLECSTMTERFSQADVEAALIEGRAMWPGTGAGS